MNCDMPGFMEDVTRMYQLRLIYEYCSGFNVESRKLSRPVYLCFFNRNAYRANKAHESINKWLGEGMVKSP
jgi:hypothetical protein